MFLRERLRTLVRCIKALSDGGAGHLQLDVDAGCKVDNVSAKTRCSRVEVGAESVVVTTKLWVDGRLLKIDGRLTL